MKPGGYRTCIHCGTPYSATARKDSAFCCSGCEYVHRLIQREGLEHYYDLRDRRIAPVQPAALQPRDYSWLETRAAECERGAEGPAETVLDLEGISCVGCVWLIEKRFRLQPGAVRIEINTQYGQVRLQWRPGIFRMVDFAREIQQFGYLLGPPSDRPRQESRRLLGRLGLCGAFALNAMLFTLPRYLGMDPDFSLAPLFELLTLLFATLSLLAGGSYFIKRGFQGLRSGVLHIDFPIALGILVAWAGSLFGWLLGETRFLYFDFVAIFIFLMLVGRWVQERALENNRNRLLSGNRAPREAHVIGDDLVTESTVALAEVQAGQRLRILPGEVVPVLAELESREAAVSLEWINGESAMRSVRGGQYVPAGAQNIGIDPLLVKARQTWDSSLLRRLLQARPGEERNRHVEAVLRAYLVVVLFLALGGAAFWVLVPGQPLTALQVALSVLVVSCPCALGVAYPLAQEWAVLELRRHGVFVRKGELFHGLGGVREVILDKTGTLTLEAPELEQPEILQTLAETDRALLRQMVAGSLHPTSRAVREALLGMEPGGAALPGDLVIREEIGMGLEAASVQSGATWTLGRPDWKAAPEADPLPPGRQAAFRRNGRLLAAFSFHEVLREDARAAVAQLRKRFAVTLLSGDRLEKVRQMARDLDLPESAAVGEQSPTEKEAFVEKLVGRGVLFIGDGANDALAFGRARVRGTPATPHGLLQDKADFFFTGRSLRGLLELFRIHQLRRKAVRSAFIFAIAYNVVVAAVALAGKMHPLLAAVLMPLSSLSSLTIVALAYRRGNGKLKA